ncbi:hypothetical protein BGZ50_000420 [Haplosporangium sp. Z 11]|nr:hypothetical protein BGZ50_000420 [Haplosporangium sp. Z 11]
MRYSIPIVILTYVSTFLSVTSASAAPGIGPDGCISICNKFLDPICGRNDKGEFRMFGNPCMFDGHNCANPTSTFAKTDMANCEEPKPATAPKKCNTLCFRNLDPVCGRNDKGEFKEFGNPCTFESYNCLNPTNIFAETTLSNCRKPTPAAAPKKCNNFCFGDRDPVCGRNGKGELKEFDNPCIFETYNCLSPANTYVKTTLSSCRNPKPKACGARACNKFERDPVCGRNANGETKIFATPCIFEDYNCKNLNRAFQKIDISNCASMECPNFCTRFGDPTCARGPKGEFIDFGNTCELEKHNCENPIEPFVKTDLSKCYPSEASSSALQTSTSLKVSMPKECNKKCPSSSNAVCGRALNGAHKRFDNLCALENHNCKNPKNKHTKTGLFKCRRV